MHVANLVTEIVANCIRPLKSGYVFPIFFLASLNAISGIYNSQRYSGLIVNSRDHLLTKSNNAKVVDIMIETYAFDNAIMTVPTSIRNRNETTRYWAEQLPEKNGSIIILNQSNASLWQGNIRSHFDASRGQEGGNNLNSFDRSRGEYQITTMAENFVEQRKECPEKANFVLVLENSEINQSEHCEIVKTVTSLYGEKPVILGLEHCSTYREMIRNAGTSPLLRLAGMCNTGTNALNKLLLKNLEGRSSNDPHGKEYAVPWGKHLQLMHHLANVQTMKNGTYTSLNGIDDVISLPSGEVFLPIILVRDPYRWMTSMCKAPYGHVWQRGDKCPNLVNRNTGEPRSLFFKFGGTKTSLAASLVDFWNDWNRQYINAKFPRLMIRFEDLVLHSEEIFQKVIECAGIQFKEPFQYQIKKAKRHGKASGLFDEILKHGNASTRISGYFPDDLEFSRRTLDAEIMRIFHYSHP